MKTLKKTLCLVLALVMAFSLMSVASATNLEKYTDADKVGAAYEEAVDVLLGLGIVNGVSATELAPEGYYTRAQAAKIATYLAVGPTVAEMLPAGDSFEDVPAKHWAAKYISYCAEKGILNGVTATTYDPEAYVTGYQFAKMILAAAGYGQNNEFVGSGWAIATAQWALDADNNLFAGDAAAATNDPITRQQAMLIAFNALKNVEFQKYSKDEGVYTDISVATMGTKNYSLAKVENVIINTNSANAATTITNALYEVNTGIDVLGHQVNIWYVDANNSTDYTAKEKVVAVVDETSEISVASTTTKTELKTALNAAGVTAAATVDTIKNGVVGNGSDTTVPCETGTAAAGFAGTVLVADKAVIGVKVADDVVATKVSAVTTTTAGAETITLAGVADPIANNATSDVINEYAGIAANDYVTYVQAGAIYNLTKVATVEGKITKNANGTLTVNGTEYKAFAGTDNSGIVDDAINFSNTYTLYLTPAGEYFAIKVKTADSSTAAGLLYTTMKYTKTVSVDNAYGDAGNTVLNYIQGVDSTGAEVNYQVTATEYASLAEKQLYTVKTSYDTTLKATVADLTVVSDGDTAGGIYSLTEKTTTAADIKIDTNDYYASDVKFIYVDDKGADLTVTVKEGKQVLTAEDVVFYGTKASATVANYDVKFVFVDGTVGTATTGTGVIAGFEANASTTKVPYTAADGTTAEAYVHTVYIDGVKTDIQTASDAAISGYYSYTVDSVTGLYTVGSAYSYVKAAAKITNNYNGIITTANATDIDVTGAKIVNVMATTDADYSKVATTAAGLTVENVAIVCDSKGAAVVVYVVDYNA